MSAEAMGYVYRYSPHSGATFDIHLAIADSVNDQNENEFWMTKPRLAAKARISLSSVKTAITTLISDGYLELLQESDGRYPSRYRFLFPETKVVYESRHQSTGQPSTGQPLAGNRSTDDTNRPVVDRQPVNLETISRPYKEITQENPRRTQEEPKTLPLCSLLAELMVENQCKPPTISNTWLDAERRLVNIDHRDPAEAEKVLRWCQKDQFWRANILSLPKFRAQYDKLRLAMQRNNTPSWQKEDATNRNVDRIVGDDRRNGSYSVQKAKPVPRPVFQFATTKTT